MKILIVDRASAFSIWTLMNRIATAAAARGWSVVYVVLDEGIGGAPPPPPGVRVHVIRTAPRRNTAARVGQWVRFARAFPRILAKERPDLVHTNFCVPGVAARLIARLMGVGKVVSTYHELRGSLNLAYRLGLAVTAPLATWRVFVSRACARSFGEHDAAPFIAGEAPPRSRTLVIRNGVAAAAPATAPKLEPGAKWRIVAAGRLAPEKGFAELSHAARMIRDRGRSVELDIFGDGPARAALETAAAGAAQFHGWASHESVLSRFADADIVALPSDGTQEGFGLAFAEALVVATRVVASDIPVFHELAEGLSDGVTFFEPGDAGSLARAIEASCAAHLDPASIADRRTRAAARFDLDAMAAAYLDIYAANPR